MKLEDINKRTTDAVSRILEETISIIYPRSQNRAQGAPGNTGYCLASVSPVIVPLSVVEVGGPLLPVPTKVVEKPPVTAIEFPVMTPVKLIVNGSLPPLDKLPVMLPFDPVTEPVAVSVKELAAQESFEGQDTTVILILDGIFADPVIEPSLFCVRFRVTARLTEAA
jgi:hypothetical protein